jgi:hypothetical protein
MLADSQIDQLYFGRETRMSLEHDIDLLVEHIKTTSLLEKNFCILALQTKLALYEQVLFQESLTS